jgi:glutamine phosphoribosylpyrophosphate amidotransferase
MLQLHLVDVHGHISNSTTKCIIEYTSDVGLKNVFLETTSPSIHRMCVMGCSV